MSDLILAEAKEFNIERLRMHAKKRARAKEERKRIAREEAERKERENRERLLAHSQCIDGFRSLDSVDCDC
jgi:hypothetical protein